MSGLCTVQGEAVFCTMKEKQPFTALPELSSAELPVRDDESVSNIFEKSVIIMLTR